MATNYEQASKELDKIIEISQKLDKENTKLLEAKEIFESLTKMINEQIGGINPIMKVYLDDIMSIRMSFGREVAHILEHVRQLNDIAKSEPNLLKLAHTIEKFNEALKPEVIDNIKTIFKI